MPKTLVVTTRLPFPPVSGQKIMLGNVCRALAEHCGHEIVVAGVVDDPSYPEQRPAFIARLHPLHTLSFPKRLGNLLRYSFFGRSLPQQVALFYDRSIIARVRAIIEDEKPDAVVVSLVRATEYCKDFKGFKIFDMTDRLSSRYAQQLRMIGKIENPFGDYLSRVPSPIAFVLRREYFKKGLLAMEQRLLERYEADMINTYDATVVVNPLEHIELRAQFPRRSIFHIPIAVDIEWLGQDLGVRPEPDTIAFLGSLNVSHNEDTVLHFLREIFPLIRARRPGAQFLCVGEKPTRKILEHRNDPGVKITGRVDDFRPWVRRAQLFMNSVRFGTGIKVKILEAMAMGVPVVTTTIGNSGLGARNEYEILVADQPRTFADAVIRLFEDAPLRERIAANALALVRSRYSIRGIAEAWKDLFVKCGHPELARR